MVNMKPTAVRVSLSRARKTIREQLKKQHNYGLNWDRKAINKVWEC